MSPSATPRTGLLRLRSRRGGVRARCRAGAAGSELGLLEADQRRSRHDAESYPASVPPNDGHPGRRVRRVRGAHGGRRRSRVSRRLGRPPVAGHRNHRSGVRDGDVGALPPHRTNAGGLRGHRRAPVQHGGGSLRWRGRHLLVDEFPRPRGRGVCRGSDRHRSAVHGPPVPTAQHTRTRVCGGGKASTSHQP